MKPRKPIRRVSVKRAKQNAEYSKRRKAFLEAHPYCQWWLAEKALSELEVTDAGMIRLGGYWQAVPRAVEIHHKRGRFGSRLNEEEYWMAVSMEGHRWIHNNPKEAYEKGYLLNR